MRLELQHVVGQVGDIAQVTEHVVDAIFQELRGDRLVTLRQRLEGIGVDRVVEAEDRPVDAFPWIFLSRRLGRDYRRQKQAGTDTGPGHPIDQADPKHRVTPRTGADAARPTPKNEASIRPLLPLSSLA
ncbi:hypothetical protein D9M71_727620 [compost metagenome]